jgi:hypothetical protein
MEASGNREKVVKLNVMFTQQSVEKKAPCETPASRQPIERSTFNKKHLVLV